MVVIDVCVVVVVVGGGIGWWIGSPPGMASSTCPGVCSAAQPLQDHDSTAQSLVSSTSPPAIR